MRFTLYEIKLIFPSSVTTSWEYL